MIFQRRSFGNHGIVDVATAKMANKPKLWTHRDEVDFHSAVVKLAKLRQNPQRDIDYRMQPNEVVADDGDHILGFWDELQLADHCAFLTHDEESPLAIAAACVEETASGQAITIRVARNELHDERQVDGLRQVLNTLQSCLREGESNNRP